jgi:Uncharacterized conserved protein (DUF2183)
MASTRNSSRLCALLFAVCSACAADESIEDLGTITDGKTDTALPRTVAIELGASESKRFRITTAAFVARLEQTGTVDAQLTAKHYDFVFESATTAEPQLTATADATSRNWTLTVYNRGTADLTATLVVDVPRDTGDLGIVSDIDKTVMPPETAAGEPPPYPGIASLLTTLEGPARGDVHYVTARQPARVVTIPAWLALHGAPAGSIDTGISGIPNVAQAEKIRDITRLFDATGDQPYVLFGDTSQRDPEVYRAILTKYPSRVSAVFIHKVNTTVDAARVDGMHLVENYAQAAAFAFGDDLITEAQARKVMNDAKAAGLAITAAEIDDLIDAAR